MRRTMLIDPRGARWHVEVPETRRERMRGLLDRSELAAGHAMLLERARSVHTIGMTFPITVAFLDRHLRVRSVARAPPGRVLFPRIRARNVLECPDHTDVRIGDRFRSA